MITASPVLLFPRPMAAAASLISASNFVSVLSPPASRRGVFKIRYDSVAFCVWRPIAGTDLSSLFVIKVLINFLWGCRHSEAVKCWEFINMWGFN